MNMLLLFLVVAVSFCVSPTHAKIVGIDYGSEYIKVAAVKGTSVDIVLNEAARRKSFNFIGFRGAERYIGDDARSLAPRFPDNMFPMSQNYLRLAYGKGIEYTEKRHLAVDLTKNEKRGSAEFHSRSNPDTTYAPEVLTGMMLAYCRNIAQDDANTKISEAVVTVPDHFDMWQRHGFVQSASLVGIKMRGLIHSTTATALQFGIQNRGFGNKTVHLVVFDMGATSLEVGVYKFRPTEAPKEGKVKLADSLGTIDTLAVVHDSELGGRTFDSCIAKVLQDEFINTLGVEEVLSGFTLPKRKAIHSLMRAAKNAREVLSANTFTPVTVEGVAPDKDFSTKITRETFETECAPLFARSVSAAERAMAEAGLSVPDIQSFELMGGAARTPRIVNDLSSFMGRTVDRTINSDEVAALGATYYGARLSSQIRVRSFAVNDHARELVTFQASTEEGTGAYGAKRILFDQSPFGARKSITLNRTKDFSLRLFTNRVNGPERYLGEVAVKGTEAAAEVLGIHDNKFQHPNNAAGARVQFRLNDAGIFEPIEAALIFKRAVNKTKKNSSELSSEQGGETYLSFSKSEQPLDVSFSWGGPLPLDKEDFADAKATVSEVEKLERIKHEKAVAKNNLESYIQWIKYDGILDNEEIKREKFVTDEQISSIQQLVSEIQEWIEDGEGSEDGCATEKYVEKQATLKQLVDRYWAPYMASKNPSAAEDAKGSSQNATDVPKETDSNETQASQEAEGEEL